MLASSNTQPRSRKELGEHGEQAVVNWLKNDGFTIVERNYRTRHGEIDIIACKKKLLAFVEVKLRQTLYVPIADMVPWRKQNKITAVAKKYISTHNHNDMVYRFDVAVVTHDNNGYSVTYLPNAFQNHD